nr:hypothetical protein [Tanacetum cinerariifolium]
MELYKMRSDTPFHGWKGCGGPSDTPVCYLCTCEQCGNILIHGTCLKCNSGAGNSFTYDPIPESFNKVQIILNPPPQSHFNIYLCQICESNSHYGYECPQRVPLVYEPKPCYNQNFSDNDYSHDLPDCRDLPEAYQCQPPQYTVNHPIFNAHNDLLSSQNKLMEQLTSMCNMLLVCYDDDDDEERSISLKDNIISGLPPCAAITTISSTEEPDNTLSMGDEYLDTIRATKSDEFIKTSVESLVPIPSESEGISDNMCDMPFHNNSTPLDVSKDQFKDFSNSNDKSTSIDDDSFSIDNIEYVEASPPNSELVSLEVMEIVIPEVGGINDDTLLTIKDDILREKLLNVNLLIANIEALYDNPTPSFNFMTKSSSTPLNSLLEETNTFDNSVPEFEIFFFDLEEISSGSTTTHFDISLPEYEAFYDDHISSGSTTTHFDSSFYDSIIFDLSINPFPPADRSDFYEFAYELAHIISLPNYDCFCFKNEPNSGDFTMDVVEDIFSTREPRVHVHNSLPSHPPFQLKLDFILSSECLFAYVVLMFLPFLSYSVAPQYLLSFGNEDTIFDPVIYIAPQYLLSFGNEDTIFDPVIYSYHISSFMPDVSHRSGTFIKFNVLNESPIEILFSTCSPHGPMNSGSSQAQDSVNKH